MRLFARARSSDASVVERDATRSNVTTIILFLSFYAVLQRGRDGARLRGGRVLVGRRVVDVQANVLW